MRASIPTPAVAKSTPAHEPERIPHYQLPLVPIALPSWWQPPADTVIGSHNLQQTISFANVGAQVAIFQWFGGYLVAHADEGVLGTLPRPVTAQWAAVDNYDRILIAHTDGTLRRAASWQEAQSLNNFVLLGKVAGARTWDLSKGVVAAATADTVHVSYDAGNTFAAAPAWRGSSIDLRVMTRSDRTVVAQARRPGGGFVTRLLSRGAKKWREGPEDLDALTRVGDWIGESEPTRCGRVLARNGRTWVEANFTTALDDWELLTALSSDRQLRPDRPLPRLAVPRAPTKRNKCLQLGFPGGKLRSRPGRVTEPIIGTPGPAPRPTARWHTLWTDGRCRSDSKHARACAGGDSLVRRPHVATWDEADRKLQIIDLPPTCKTVESLRTVAGVGVLRCSEAGALDVWTIGSGRMWHREAKMGARNELPHHTTVASDGTMLMHGVCSGNAYCEPSWLRAPAELGANWTMLGGGLTFRVLAGGRALKISGAHDRGYTLSVIDPTAGETIVVEGLRGGTLAALEVRDGREIALRWGAGPWRILAADGTVLAPTPPSTPSDDRVTWNHSRWHPQVIGAGDFNGDGMNDLAVVRRGQDERQIVAIVPGRKDWSGYNGNYQVLKTTRITPDLPNYSIDSIAGIGDFNGDGRDDIAVSLLVPPRLSGEVYVIFGTEDVIQIRGSAIRKGDGGVWIPSLPTANPYSASVAGLGDVNGDGLADLGLGLRYDGDLAGALFVIWGKTDGTPAHLRELSRNSGGFELRGSPGQAVGHHMAPLGDFDGDGSEDFAVFASADDLAPDQRQIFVVRGGAARPHTSGDINARVQTGDAYVIDSGGAGVLTGVASAGDINADGVGDLLVLQDGAGGENLAAGRVVVLFGGVPVPKTIIPALQGRGGFRIDGEFAFDQVGERATGVGDLDGDGKDDLVIGAPHLERGGQPTGRVYVVHGRGEMKRVQLTALSPAAVLQPSPQGLRFGGRVAAVGDVDGDGRPDYVVTALYHPDAHLPTPIHLMLGPSRESHNSR